MRKIYGYIFGLSLLAYGCDKTPPRQFVSLEASRTGVDFRNTLSESPELNILNYLYFYNGAGVAAADFNNDGLVDLYFTANQAEDQLYLNLGNLRFKNITAEAGIANTGNWTTGVTHLDINHDGRLDIYVCKVGNYRSIRGKNLLFVNQGINEEGIPVFQEDAASYDLDFRGFSTQASFFDFDLDGDLDLFLLNHSVHPNLTYGKGSQRQQPDPASGDKLFRNDDGKYTNISEEAGIFQGRIGYGLGITVSDLNRDGYPDLYIGNDFFENDYVYINQGDGTFKELITSDDRSLGHTSHYSMGNDIADINNDGLTDIVSLDMLPEDLETYKTSGLEFPYPTYQYYLKNGYSPQYMQNTLHVNLGNETFSEIGQLSGIAATEWSWSVLLADFDNDSYKDLYITNGIKRATNDMDFISFIANESIQKRLEQGMSAEDMSFIEEIPQIKAANYFLKNEGDLSFEDVTNSWFEKRPSYSNGAAYADLDNDGDLDLVVNNVDETAFVLENKGVKNNDHHFLKLDLKGEGKNPFGIGAVADLYIMGEIQTRENYPTRGFLSAITPTLHFGLGKNTKIDSLRIRWPGGKTQVLKNLPADTTLTLYASGAITPIPSLTSPMPAIALSEAELTLGYRHREPATLEFERDPLVPFANTNEGPAISVVDINKDGREDLFVSGAKAQPSQLFLQTETGSFVETQRELFEVDALSEDVSQVFFDANGDGWEDLLVVSGGNEFPGGIRLQPRLYINHQGELKKDPDQFKGIWMHASKAGAHDIDGDGDLDVLIASDQMPLQFGSTSTQFVFLNDGKGRFTHARDERFASFTSLGSVKDFVWADVDRDGEEDLITAGYWEPLTVLINQKGTLRKLENTGLEKTHGWWNTVRTADFDGDGDLDIVAGNWGLNTRLKASLSKPITLYRMDFDDNGTIDPVVTYFEGKEETPFASKDELVKQLPNLNKKFLSYTSFAKAGLNDLFPANALSKAQKKQLYELGTLYFSNDGKGRFSRKELPVLAQASSTHDILIYDLNGDGFKDLLLVGNTYEISTQLGRMDASHGLILLNDQRGNFRWQPTPEIDISGPARCIVKIKINGTDHFVIGINDDHPIFLTTNKEKVL
ncbi:Repeat domain-containing protein [Muriicola jejuensis]|uniref:ASPIC/UnbV domain-containing protein n=1 Tax=Muriicola jejuensis TaxID=504488 RepID=A0A6P0UJG1_9FLAO|nr:VCBS repeat-containing protein [Muriicola jejuensis]NER10336.1 hypothetical protein [Muriicola jejuensis]SMP01229.1 Repeat domain-containing protein [Muriicola jejuensis]